MDRFALCDAVVLLKNLMISFPLASKEEILDKFRLSIELKEALLQLRIPDGNGQVNHDGHVNGPFNPGGNGTGPVNHGGNGNEPVKPDGDGDGPVNPRYTDVLLALKHHQTNSRLSILWLRRLLY